MFTSRIPKNASFRICLVHALILLMPIATLNGCASTSPSLSSSALRNQGRRTLPRHSFEQGLENELSIHPDGASAPSQSVTQPRPEPIRVLGGVEKPGNIPYHAGADLSFYLTQAGGSGNDELPTKVQIIRGAPGKKKVQVFNIADRAPLPQVQSGDIVIVHSKKRPSGGKTMTLAASAVAVISTVAILLLAV